MCVLCTSEEEFSGEINWNHCCSSEPKRSHSVSFGRVRESF